MYNSKSIKRGTRYNQEICETVKNRKMDMNAKKSKVVMFEKGIWNVKYNRVYRGGTPPSFYKDDRSRHIRFLKSKQATRSLETVGKGRI